MLFCDIVESTRLAGRLDPEQMHEVMDRALRLMAEAVHRYGGTVNQFLGDGLMALFGAPVSLEDHALRAVEAALAIQETLAGYDAELGRAHGIALSVRFGLNTGEVVVGRIGDDLRMDYTAVGQTTHLAAHIAWNLDFIPLGDERYDLAISRDELESPRLEPILTALHSADFRKTAATLAGYDLARSGKIIARVK